MPSASILLHAVLMARETPTLRYFATAHDSESLPRISGQRSFGRIVYSSGQSLPTAAMSTMVLPFSASLRLFAK